MKSSTISICCAAFALGAFAAPLKFSEKTPEERAAAMEKFGGMVVKPGNGKSVLFTDMTSDGGEMAETFTSRSAMFLHLTFELRKMSAPAGDIGKAVCALKDKTHPAVIALVDMPDEPALGVFPEEAAAFVNIAPLKTKDSIRYRARVNKELWRAVGFAMGGYAMPRPGCVMEAVFSTVELDKVPGSQLMPTRYGMIYKSAAKLDIHDSRPVPYVKALREGWAPPATNDAQRAAVKKWEEAKAKRSAREAEKAAKNAAPAK